MIAKRVERKSGSHYSNLIQYLLREGKPKQSQSIESTSTSNCEMDDIELAVKEIEATQAQNTRSKIDRTYHLIASFPDAEKPTPEQVSDIERELCTAIGLGDHQRISVAHKDTGNFHIHLAVNKIHPETCRAIEPYYDHYKLDEACAALELKHGLQRDNRIDRESHRDRIEPGRQAGRTGDLEAHQGQASSFKSWLAESREEVTAELRRAKDWTAVHQALSKQGLSLRKRGAGLVIGNQAGDTFVKASELGRDFSKAKLESRLGEYRAPDDRTTIIPGRDGYHPPSRESKHPNNDPLRERFQKEKARHKSRRSELLNELSENRKAALKQQKAAYGKVKLGVLFDRSLSHQKKQAITKHLAVTRLETSRESYARHQAERARIMRETKPHRWPDFLRDLARDGDRDAVQQLKRLETQQRRQQRRQAHGRGRHGRARGTTRDQGR